MRFWLFQKFIVFLTKPQHLEFVMNAPETSDRGQVSSIIDDIIGLPGLFTSRGKWCCAHQFIGAISILNAVGCLV